MSTIREPLNSIYRGIVKNNQDPENRGRCRIFIPGVFSSKFVEENKIELLPWAEPAMSLFGGSWKNPKHGNGEYPDQLNKEVGICSVPHGDFKIPFEGAQVWVFFENGFEQNPVYFASCQSGEGWFAEHEAQHIIQTDNVRIRVDEQPIIDENEPGEECGKSSCAFPTYNDKCTLFSSKLHHKEKVPARVDIEIWNEGFIGLNLIIKGDVNMKVEGNVYEHIIGDKHITHEGNLYYKHVGDSEFEQTGVNAVKINGDSVEHRVGQYDEIVDGDKVENISGNSSLNVMKNLSEHIEQNYWRRTNLIDRAMAGTTYCRKSTYTHFSSYIDHYVFSKIEIRSLSRVLITSLSDIVTRIRSLVDTRVSAENELLIDSLNLIQIKAQEEMEIVSKGIMNIYAVTEFVINSSANLVLTAKAIVKAEVLGAWNFLRMYIPFIPKPDIEHADDFPDA